MKIMEQPDNPNDQPDKTLLLRDYHQIFILPGSSDDRMGESSLSVSGFVAGIFRDAHLTADFESALSEGRWIDDRPGTTFHLEQRK